MSRRWLITLSYERNERMNAALKRGAVYTLDGHRIRLTGHRAGQPVTTSFLLERKDILDVCCAIPDRVRAIAKALRLIRPPISIHIRPAGVRLTAPRELMTLAEIGRLFGVSRQRAQQLSVRSDFPGAAARTDNGPLYAVEDIEEYRRNVRATPRPQGPP